MIESRIRPPTSDRLNHELILQLTPSLAQQTTLPPHTTGSNAHSLPVSKTLQRANFRPILFFCQTGMVARQQEELRFLRTDLVLTHHRKRDYDSVGAGKRPLPRASNSQADTELMAQP